MPSRKAPKRRAAKSLNYWINQRAVANAQIDSSEHNLAEYVAKKRKPGINTAEKAALTSMITVDADYRQKWINRLNKAVKKMETQQKQRARFPVAQYRLLRAGKVVRDRLRARLAGQKPNKK